MADKNLLSYNGPKDNGRVVDLESLRIDASGGGYSSAIKCSTGLAHFELHAKEIRGGHDACVDVNNLCNNLDLYMGRLFPNGQFAITAKGGSTAITLHGELCAHGKRADVILGDWSDQSHEKTTGVVIDLESKTGKPIRVLVLKAEKPLLLPTTGPYKYLFPSPALGPLHTLIVFGFETLRRWGFFREEAN